MTKKANRKWNEFDKKISRLILAAMQYKGWNQLELSERIGCSQSNISNLLKTQKRSDDRHWTIPTLLNVAEALGTTIYNLMYEADSTNGNIPLFFVVGDTEPCSRKRLQALVYASAGFVGDEANNITKRLYILSLMETEAPTFCADYYAGKVSDAQAVMYLQQANKVFLDDKYSEKITFGRAVKYVYTKKLELLD